MCKILKKTKDLSKEEWLKLRKQGIGGSDAGAVCGLNPYTSPMDIYSDKTSDTITDIDSEAMKQGKDLEHYVAGRFTDATSLKVRRSNAMYVSENHPFMIADVDRLIVGESAGVECKTASPYSADKWKDGNIPAHYLAQCYHYMAVLNTSSWYIAVIIYGKEFKFVKIERDEEIINNLIKIEEEMSFIAALMNAAQLGLEPNTPLGQAYLIPFKNKDKVECKFIVGYKGILDLVYRNENVQTIQAQIVYENDIFSYELGLESKLYHKPALHDRGEMTAVYALYKLSNGGYGFEVLSKDYVVQHATRFSQGMKSSYSPWNTDFESIAKKTAIRKVLKFAPLKTESLRALETDETIKHELSIDMTEINDDTIIEEN